MKIREAKTRNMNLVAILIYCLPLIFQATNLSGNTLLYKVIYLLIVFISLFKNKKITLQKKTIVFFCYIVITYFIVPLFSMEIRIESILYFFFIVIFLFVINEGSKLINQDLKKAIKLFLIFNTIPLIFQIIKNIKLITRNSIMSIFNGDRISRIDFGYSHANFASAFIVIELILIYLYAKNSNKKIRKILAFAAIIAFLFPLFSTGSRSALYSIFIFVISELILFVAGFYKKYKRNIYIILFLIILVVLIVKFGEEIIRNSSGRDTILLNNLKVLLDSGRLWLGTGGGSVSNIGSIEGINYSDNWYITTIINCGLIGFIFIMGEIIYIFISLFKNSNTNSYSISIFIMLFVYSFAENMLFTPGVALSWFSWIFIIGNLKRKDRIRKIEIKER